MSNPMSLVRAGVLRRIATLRALALTAGTTEEYLFFASREHAARARVEPLSVAEQDRIAQAAMRHVMEYESMSNPCHVEQL